MTQEEAIKRLINDLAWPEKQVNIGIRAGFRCEYCGKDLLASYEDYDLWQIDHIVPGWGNEMENLALSCKLCNFVKHDTDPSVTAISHHRTDLIDSAIIIVNERRKKKEFIFVKTLEAVSALR